LNYSGRFISEERFPINGDFKISSDEKQRLLDIEAKSLNRLSTDYPDVFICLENARPYLFHSPYCYAEKIDALKRQVEMVNRKNIRITLDIGHLYMAAKFYDFDPAEAVAEIKDLIAHTHVHDPIAEILSTFIDSYHGMLMMELRSRYFDHVEESRRNLEALMFAPKVR
jgi:hypothetical protein